MPNIGATAKKAITNAAASAAAFASSIKKMLVLPTIPPFMEMAANIKGIISGKVIKEAIKKKVDTVKDILDPTKIKDQISGDKKTGIIASIMPRQVKDLVKAAREGSKLTPKEALTGVLEKFTGVNLDQDNLLESLGGAVLDNINAQIDALKTTVMQTIVGCINKAVRDLINKFPTLDFLINLEDKLNGILGNFRNKLEQKIDAELRGLMYQKIKIHQLTLFKQSIHGSIRDICPEATPASSAEVKAFMDSFEEGKRKREEAHKEKNEKDKIEVEEDSPSVVKDSSTQQEPSPRFQQQVRQNPRFVNDLLAGKQGVLLDSMKKVAKNQKATSKNTVSSIVRRRSRLKGGARLMQMGKKASGPSPSVTSILEVAQVEVEYGP